MVSVPDGSFWFLPVPNGILCSCKKVFEDHSSKSNHPIYEAPPSEPHPSLNEALPYVQ